MKIDPLVAQIIVATNFDHFTTSDVRSAYFALKSDPSLEPSNVRRKIYAELLKLVKKDWLKKSKFKNKIFCFLIKINNFYMVNFKII